MSRVRIAAAAVAVVASLAFAGTALANSSKVTGGSTKVTASAAAAALLTSNHITMAPLAPATASGTTFTFPITGGRFSTRTLRGFIRQGGGLTLSNGTKQLTLSHLTVLSTRHGVVLDALARGQSHRVCRAIGSRRSIRHHHFKTRCLVVARVVTAQIARITDVNLSKGVATGTVTVSAFIAHAINRLAGKHVLSAGAVLGTASTSLTLG
jgi:hypothetical protein